MFEAAELGHKVKKKAFQAAVPELRTKLLAAQRALREANVPVLIVVSGVEGAGKSQVVNRLQEWLDPRGVSVHAFWEETDEERQRPRYWRFWRRLPPRGTVGVFFGSWYTQPIIEHALGVSDDGQFEVQLRRVADFERMLARDGVVLVKLWFHVSKSAQSKRIKRKRKDKRRKGRDDHWRHSPFLKRFSRHFDAFAAASEKALRLTSQADAPWDVIESEDANYRDLTVGQLLLQRMERALARPVSAPPRTQAPAVADGGGKTVLDAVDLEARVDRNEYSQRLDALQTELGKLVWKAHKRHRSVVGVFEGWDAAGKGGAIRRLTQAMDARLYRVVPIAAPTDEERGQHYLWRFWRHLPRDGYVRIYDRSWYGRVLVERVEGFCSQAEWSRAYSEINAFEEQLVAHGTIVLKFWLHLSADEQLRRFKEREVTPYKQHKITSEDWRNRDRWEAYELAVDEMVRRTSTGLVPWTLVPAESKHVARLHVLETVVEALRTQL